MDIECQNCGRIIVDKNSKFCRYCGKPLPKIYDIECQNCGEKIVNINSKFCRYCGKPLPETQIPKDIYYKEKPYNAVPDSIIYTKEKTDKHAPHKYKQIILTIYLSVVIIFTLIVPPVSSERFWKRTPVGTGLFGLTEYDSKFATDTNFNFGWLIGLFIISLVFGVIYLIVDANKSKN